MVEKGSKAYIDSKAKENDTAVEENENYNKEGWVGEPKGKLQVLWEWGWIDTSKLDYYTIRIQKDEKGTVIQETSLLHLMYQCIYFSEDDPQLQYIGSKLGATVDRTCNCHSELAGKGIEYSWGSVKIL